jgi:hypothetical protein
MTDLLIVVLGNGLASIEPDPLAMLRANAQLFQRGDERDGLRIARLDSGETQMEFPECDPIAVER